MDGAGSYSVAHRAGLLPTELTGMWGWILLRSPHQGRGSPPAPAPRKQRPGTERARGEGDPLRIRVGGGGGAINGVGKCGVGKCGRDFRGYALVWGFRNELFPLHVPTQGAKGFSSGESGKVVVPLVTAASAPGAAPACRRSPASRSVSAMIVQFGGCSPPLLTWAM